MVWLEPHSIHPVRKIIRKGAEKILRRGLRQDELDYFTTRLHANRQRQSQTQDRLGPHALSYLQTTPRATYCLSENAQAIQMGKEPTPSKHGEAQDEPELVDSVCPDVLRSWPSPVSPTGRNRSKSPFWSIRVRMDQNGLGNCGHAGTAFAAGIPPAIGRRGPLQGFLSFLPKEIFVHHAQDHVPREILGPEKRCGSGSLRFHTHCLQGFRPCFRTPLLRP